MARRGKIKQSDTCFAHCSRYHHRSEHWASGGSAGRRRAHDFERTLSAVISDDERQQAAVRCQCSFFPLAGRLFCFRRSRRAEASAILSRDSTRSRARREPCTKVTRSATVQQRSAASRDAALNEFLPCRPAVARKSRGLLGEKSPHVSPPTWKVF